MKDRIRRCVASYEDGKVKMIRLDCGHSRPIYRDRLVPDTMVCHHCSNADGGHNES